MTDTVLVTGTGGFIGFHLAEALLRREYRVIGYDNMCRYYPVSIKRARVDRLRQAGERFTHVEADLCDRETLEATFRSHRPALVCNLAAQAGVRYSIDHPHVYQQANLQGFLNLLECCRHHPVRRLVYASSSSVYGGNTKLPFAVGDPVETPISLYAATKRANELMAHCYSHLYGLQTVGHRFFTVYGPWGRPDMAMWIFAERILNGDRIPVFNQGRMQRDFTYIDDIVAGVVASLFCEELPPYSIFNLGNHRSEQLLHMIELLEQALGRPAELDLLPMQPGDVPATYADISDAREQLGFDPQTPIDVGIPRFCDWYRAHPDLAAAVRDWRNAPAAT